MTATAIGGQPRGAVYATTAPTGRDLGARPRACGGTLLAVCAVAPGAGASTLSHLIALTAAHRGTGKILLCHTGKPPEPAAPTTTAVLRDELLRTFLRPAPARASAPRVVAVPADASPARVARKLDRARGAYALTVVDCGTLQRPLERTALAHATHLAWVLPATLDGLAQARRATRLARGPGAQLLIARRAPGAQGADAPALRRLAGECAATLILIPWLTARECRREASALAGAQIALQAVLGVLARGPVRA